MIGFDRDLDADAYPVRLLLSLLGLRDEQVTSAEPARAGGAAAVLRDLAARYDPAWLPDSPGPGEAWLATLTSPDFAPRQARLLALFTTQGPPPGLVEEAARRLQDMDDHLVLAELDGQPWFAGQRPTIVDLAAFAAAGLSYDYGVEHDAYPALRRWIRRLRAVSGFIAMPGIPQFY